jgi:hypothetical protein
LNPQTIVFNQVWIASPISILKTVVLNQAQTSSLISILKQFVFESSSDCNSPFQFPKNFLESSSDCISHFYPQNNCLESSSDVICQFNPQNTCLELSSDFISHFNPQNKLARIRARPSWLNKMLGCIQVVVAKIGSFLEEWSYREGVGQESVAIAQKGLGRSRVSQAFLQSRFWGWKKCVAGNSHSGDRV